MDPGGQKRATFSRAEFLKRRAPGVLKPSFVPRRGRGGGFAVGVVVVVVLGVGVGVAGGGNALELPGGGGELDVRSCRRVRVLVASWSDYRRELFFSLLLVSVGALWS